MNAPLSRLDATTARAHLAARDFSALDLTEACLAQVDRRESIIHAWAHLDPETARARARAVDEKIRAGAPLGPLAGIPIGVKDIFNTADMPTQMGSPIWKGFTPGNDARVVHALRMADGVLLGKTVTAEFAVHTPGPTANPHNPRFMPGTSSSGSAAAVAAHMVPLALGTQTAGSIVRPASYCGVYGMKPSFGLMPRTGMLKTTDSLDTVGYFARSVEDLAVLFDVMRVRGLDYPISHAALSDDRRQRRGPRPWRVAVVRGPKWDSAEGYAQQALERFSVDLQKAGGPEIQIEERSLPSGFHRAHQVHTTIYDKTLAYYFRDEFKHGTLVSGIMREIIERGSRVTLAEFQHALAEQSALSQALDGFFEGGVDAVLNLATGGEALEGLDSVDRPDSCLIWTLCGVPAVNVPVFRGPHGMPFGAQLVARRYNDYLLLDLLRDLARWKVAPGDTHPTLD